MNDQIPADKVREILDAWERIKEYADWDDLDTLVKDIRDLLPRRRPRPTLADMTPEERSACRWMQTDVEECSTRSVIANPHWDDGTAHVLWPGGFIEEINWKSITPRPDLPRMEWPGTGQDGEEVTKVDYVSVAGGRTAYGPWTVARLRKKPDTVPALPGGWRLADHPDHGRVIVTRPEPDRDGYVYYVHSKDRRPAGFSWECCPASELTYIDQGADQ